MKLYVDADITPRLARALRSRGYDVLATHEAGNADASDDEQMSYGAARARDSHLQRRRLLRYLRGLLVHEPRALGVIVSEQLELGEKNLRRLHA